MIKNLAAGTLILGLAVLPNLNAAALVLDFSNVNNAEISFNGGGNFAFVAPSVTSPDFSITGEQHGTGAATGLDGTITGTAFTIGTVNNVGGGTEQASVTGTETLTILSPSGNLTGTLSFGSIESSNNGVGGLVNINATVDLTNITYSGTNADLLTLAAGGSGIVVASYDFTSDYDLNYLVKNAVTDAYSGSITATPEPALSGLALFGVSGLLMTIWRRRQTRTI